MESNQAVLYLLYKCVNIFHSKLTCFTKSDSYTYFTTKNIIWNINWKTFLLIFTTSNLTDYFTFDIITLDSLSSANEQEAICLPLILVPSIPLQLVPLIYFFWFTKQCMFFPRRYSSDVVCLAWCKFYCSPWYTRRF